MIQQTEDRGCYFSKKPLKFHISQSVERALVQGAEPDHCQRSYDLAVGPEKMQCVSCGRFEYVFRQQCRCGASIYQQAENELIAIYEVSWKSHEYFENRFKRWERSLRVIFGLTSVIFALWCLYLVLSGTAAHPFEPVAWFLPVMIVGVIVSKVHECFESRRAESETRAMDATNDLFRLRDELRLSSN